MEVRVDKTSLKNLERKLDKLARWGQLDAKSIRQANREVGKIYVKQARANIESAKTEIKIYDGKGNVRMTIRPDQLRKSMGVWRPKGSNTTMLAGPRASSTGRVPANSDRDGWFAAFVEAGIFGNNQGLRNKGVFENTKRQTDGAMRSKQRREYKKRFNRYAKKL